MSRNRYSYAARTGAYVHYNCMRVIDGACKLENPLDKEFCFGSWNEHLRAYKEIDSVKFLMASYVLERFACRTPINESFEFCKRGFTYKFTGPGQKYRTVDSENVAEKHAGR